MVLFYSLRPSTRGVAPFPEFRLGSESWNQLFSPLGNRCFVSLRCSSQLLRQMVQLLGMPFCSAKLQARLNALGTLLLIPPGKVCEPAPKSRFPHTQMHRPQQVLEKTGALRWVKFLPLPGSTITIPLILRGDTQIFDSVHHH